MRAGGRELVEASAGWRLFEREVFGRVGRGVGCVDHSGCFVMNRATLRFVDSGIVGYLSCAGAWVDTRTGGTHLISACDLQAH